jgi:threonine synthase
MVAPEVACCGAVAEAPANQPDAPWARRYRCRSCSEEHEIDAVRWRCDCGGLLDLTGGHPVFPLEDIRRRPRELWRWREALPFPPAEPAAAAVAMGEGAAPAAVATIAGRDVLTTLEFASPTLSFKDRGAAVLVASALRSGASDLVADSSGNAGTAIAAYAARARLRCEVFVAASTSPAKLAQIRAHGAQVRQVDGTREEVAAAAVERVEATGAFYASHVWSPFFHEGTKTWAFEVLLAARRVPDVVVVPVGNGTLLLGAVQGFRELQRAGVTERLPRIVAVQASPCAPLAAAFHAGADEVVPVVNTGTVAEGIAIAAPPRGTQCLEAVRDTGGVVVTVTDDQIGVAGEELAAQGLYVEPTAAATAAGVAVAPFDEADHIIALPLCGAGIKSPG